MLKVLRILILLFPVMTLMPAHAAEPWPSRTIRFVVPTQAGSSVDIVARVVADKLVAMLGQTIIVDNKPGAGGTIGVDAVVNAR